MSDPGSIEETIFLATRVLTDPRERVAYLEQACGDDHALRERVERMLNAEQKADQFLEDNPLQVDQTALVTIERSEALGSMIGPYKLLQQIGEGGCGIVYMAEQEQPIRRRVALKVIKPGMDTRQVIARFEAERQALAMMDHPNIARILDAGMTGSDQPEIGNRKSQFFGARPYFVMELVRGIRITDYCDQNNLATRERLDLFMKVVQAVQHAHQKGIIHRDIKPSNVLITLHDGVPVPKVIDFGIAKALEQKLTDKTLFTQFEQFIGTPAYTSPEQAEMSGLDIDTRSDIYSLGVLLYELLVGKTPFDAQELMRSGLNEMRRMIREQEPMRPSTKLSQTLVAADVRRLQSPASDRPATEEEIRASSRRLLRIKETITLLRGDLDWIVMKCLEKDRTRRYETANGLAGDIEHYLSNEPVTARPPSQLYRLGKLVRRNKLAFAAGTAVMLALLAGIVVSTWQATRARRAEQAAKEEKDSAEAVLQFFRDKVLAAGRPEGQKGGLGKDVTLRQAIDAAEAEIAKSFTNRPLVEAAIRKTIGESYRYLGELASAIKQLERALELRQQALGLEHGASLSAVDALHQACREAGKPDRALPLYEELLKLRRAMVGPEHNDTLTAMNNLGVAYCEAGKHEQAVPLLEKTLELRKARLGPGHADTLGAMHNLALAYMEVGKLDQAVTLLEETLNLSKAKLGADHGDTLNTMQCLFAAYQRAGTSDQGVGLAQEMSELTKAKRGPEHPETLVARYELAQAYMYVGQRDQAQSIFEETLKLSQAKLGPDHPHTVRLMSGLGLAYYNAGKYDRALPLLETVFGIQKTTLGADHDQTLRTMNLLSLAVDYASPDNIEKALPLYEETLRLMRTKWGANRSLTLAAMNNLGDAYTVVGRLDEALPLLEEALNLRRAKRGLDHADTRQAMNQLARAYTEAGKLEPAEALYREILGLKGDSLPAMVGLARVLLERVKEDTNNPAPAGERVAEGLQLARDYLAVARVSHTNDAVKLEESLYQAAELYYRHGHYAQAEALYRELIQSRRARLSVEHKDVIDATASLARLLADSAWAEREAKSETRSRKSDIVERAREAERLLRECLAVRQRGTNARPWRVEDVKSRLGGALVSVAAIDPALDATSREAKLAEAERFLLEGHQRLQESQSTAKKYKRDALERLVRVYDAWGKPEQLAEWQQRLDAFDKAKAPSSAPQERASP
jgi:serine/threonine protein kinase